MWQGITSFVIALHRDRMLLVLMMLTAGAEVLGFAHQALLPSLSRDVLHTGPEGLGVLNAARSVGGMLALLASMRGFTQGGGALFVAVLLSFGGSLIGLGAAPYFVGFTGVVLLVVVANGAGALADLLAQSLLQLRVPEHPCAAAPAAPGWWPSAWRRSARSRSARSPPCSASARRWARAASASSPSRPPPRSSTRGCARSEADPTGREPVR
jgi:hypothetical protein